MATPRPDGRQLRWEKHKRERRQVVIDAAVEVLESHPPGTAVQVQEIADRAGIHRTVLYRHFEDRTDLDLAVQTEVCARAASEMLAVTTLDGTPRQITRRIVGTYIRWVVAHPALVRFAARNLSGDEKTPLEESLEGLAAQIGALIEAYVDLLSVDLPDQDRDALDPWIFGLIGGVFEAARRWSSRETLSPPVDVFAELLSRNVWHQINGVTRDRGIELPDVPVEQLLELIVAGAPADISDVTDPQGD